MNENRNGKYFITSIDGLKCQTWDDFLKQIGVAFSFPDYYGQNIHAFRDCINDLSWVQEENYLLIINNSELLLQKSIQSDDRDYLIELFKIISNNWKRGPKAEGNDETRKASDFVTICN